MSQLLDLLTVTTTPPGIVGRIVADAESGGVHVCTRCHHAQPDGAYRQRKRPDGSYRRSLVCADCERRAQAERDAAGKDRGPGTG